MSTAILADCERFLTSLIEAQQTLLSLLRNKRIALARADVASLAAAQPPETAAAQRIQSLLGWRARLLDAARQSGWAGDTLQDFVRAQADSRIPTLLERFQISRRLSKDLQHESWVQWVVTNRCCKYFSDVLELIAQQGRTAPTYHEAHWTSSGGAVLDANV